MQLLKLSPTAQSMQGNGDGDCRAFKKLQLHPRPKIKIVTTKGGRRKRGERGAREGNRCDKAARKEERRRQGSARGEKQKLNPTSQHLHIYNPTSNEMIEM